MISRQNSTWLQTELPRSKNGKIFLKNCSVWWLIMKRFTTQQIWDWRKYSNSNGISPSCSSTSHKKDDWTVLRFYKKCSTTFAFCLELARRRETQTGSPFSNLVIYSLEMPKVERSGRPGRPRFEISEDVLLELRSYGFTWKQVADMLLVSRCTIRRRVVEYGLQETTGFSALSDEQIDFYVKQFIEEHGNLVGWSMVQGFLKSLGFRLQRRRVRASIYRVDPHNSRIRWAIVVSRRAYSAQGP